MRFRAHRVRLTLRAKLLLLNGMVAIALITLSLLAAKALQMQRDSSARHLAMAEGQHLAKQAEVMFDSLRADVMASMLLGQVDGLDAYEARQRVRDDGGALYETLQALERADLPDAARAQLGATTNAARIVALKAHQIAKLGSSDRVAALRELPGFETQFKAARVSAEELGQALARHQQDSQARAAADTRDAELRLMVVCVATIAAASGFVALLTAGVRRRLRWLGGVAGAIADGDHDRRVGDHGEDELGALGLAIDRMADELSGSIGQMRSEAVAASFGKELTAALDMADSEVQIADVAKLAMGHIAADQPMELMLSDASRANLERAAEHPSAGAAGCSVASPFDCVAVRRGQMTRFAHSQAIDACRHLRGRPEGACAAVCVPVTFMGRAVGVVHARSAVDRPLSDRQADDLATLGAQLGTRIGTVRAFAKSQLRASTDGLTGLSNRRTLERHLHEACQGSAPFTFIMCDLDHFKLLNDGHGHAAGDSALRTFAEVARQAFRGADVVARWGGEEFAMLLQQCSAEEATRLVDRLRERLARSLLKGNCPVFTASFGISDSKMARVPDELVRLADMALYEAKGAGRDRACVATAGTGAELSHVVRRVDRSSSSAVVSAHLAEDLEEAESA